MNCRLFLLRHLNATLVIMSYKAFIHFLSVCTGHMHTPPPLPSSITQENSHKWRQQVLKEDDNNIQCESACTTCPNFKFTNWSPIMASKVWHFSVKRCSRHLLVTFFLVLQWFIFTKEKKVLEAFMLEGFFLLDLIKFRGTLTVLEDFLIFQGTKFGNKGGRERTHYLLLLSYASTT